MTGKNSADIKMVCDAIELAFTKRTSTPSRW